MCNNDEAGIPANDGAVDPRRVELRDEPAAEEIRTHVFNPEKYPLCAATQAILADMHDNVDKLPKHSFHAVVELNRDRMEGEDKDGNCYASMAAGSCTITDKFEICKRFIDSMSFDPIEHMMLMSLLQRTGQHDIPGMPSLSLLGMLNTMGGPVPAGKPDFIRALLGLD